MELCVLFFPGSSEPQKAGRSGRLLATASQELRKKKRQTATLATVAAATTAFGARGRCFSGLFRRCCSGQPPVATGRSRSAGFQMLRGLALHPPRGFCRGFSSTDSFRREICFLGFGFFPRSRCCLGREAVLETRMFAWCVLCSLSWPLGPERGIHTTLSVFPGTIRGTSSAFVCLCISWLFLFSFSKLLICCFFCFFFPHLYLFAVVSAHW